MAVRKDVSGDTLRRTTNLTGNTYTVMGWFKISVDTNDYSCFLSVEADNGLDGHWYVGTNGTGTTLISYNPSADGPNGSSLTVGTWYHVALVRQGTGASDLIVYLNGVQDTTHGGGSNDATAGVGIGCRVTDAFDSLNGCAAAVKEYNAVLTAAEIVQEMRQYLPKRLANLNAWYPLLSTADDEVDYSGQGRTLTVAGTWATEDGPPIPWSMGGRRIYIPAAGGAPTGPPKKGTLALMGVGI
jgi:hypothetical protein